MDCCALYLSAETPSLLPKQPAGLEISYSPSWQQKPDLDNTSSPNEYFNVSQTYRVGVEDDGRMLHSSAEATQQYFSAQKYLRGSRFLLCHCTNPNRLEDRSVQTSFCNTVEHR